MKRPTRLFGAVALASLAVCAGAQSAEDTSAPPAPNSTYFFVPVWGLKIGSTPAQLKPNKENLTFKTHSEAGAHLWLSPSELTFSARKVGDVSAPQTVEIKNLGVRTINLGQLFSTSLQYQVTSNCDGVVLPPLASCLFNVSFAPVDGTRPETTYNVPFVTGIGSGRVEGTASAILEELPVALQPSLDSSLFPPGFGGGGGGGGEDGTGLPNGSGARAKIDFADAVVNISPSYYSFQLRSTGGVPLKVLSVGTKGAGYSVTTDCELGAALATGETCNIKLKFAPPVIGPHEGEFSLRTNNYNGALLTADLSGLGIEYYASFSQASTWNVNFGEVVQNYTSTPTKTITIINDGLNKDLRISSLSHSTIELPSFKVVSDKCTNIAVPVGGSCTLEVAIDNKTLGSAGGVLELVHNGQKGRASPTAIAIKGDVVAQRLEMSTATKSVAFGDFDVGLSKVMTVEYTNTGNAPHAGLNASIGGVVGGNHFTVNATTCAAQIAPGGKCTIDIRAYSTASSVTEGTANLVLTPRGANTTPLAPIALSGRVVNRTLAVSAPVTAFGLQSSQRWNGPMTLSVKNTGNIQLRPVLRDGVSYLVAKGYDFTQGASDCAVALAPGESCEWTFMLKPTGTTSYSQPVVFSPLSGVNTVTGSISLTAQGTPQTFTLTYDKPDLGDIYPGESYEFTATLSNVSQDNVTLTSVTSGIWTSGNNVTTLAQLSNNCTQSIVAGASCQLKGRVSVSNYLGAPLPSSPSHGSLYVNLPYAATSTVFVQPKWRLVAPNYTWTLDSPETTNFTVSSGLRTPTVTYRLSNKSSRGHLRISSKEATTVGGWLSTGQPSSVDGEVVCAPSAYVQPGTSCVMPFYAQVSPQAPTGKASATLATKLYSTNVSELGQSLDNKIMLDLVGPTISMDRTSHDFGVIGSNTTATTQFLFSPSHGGNVYLNNSDIAFVSGNATASFKWAKPTGAAEGGPDCVTGTVMPAGSSCAIEVTITPGNVITDQLAISRTLQYRPSNSPETVKLFTVSAVVDSPKVVVTENNFVWSPALAYQTQATKYSVFKNVAQKGVATLHSGSSATRFSWVHQTSSIEFNGKTYPYCLSGNSNVVLRLNPGEECVAGLYPNGNRAEAAPATPESLKLKFLTTAEEYDVTATWALPALEVVNSVVFETPVQSGTFDKDTDKVLTLTNRGDAVFWFGVPGNARTVSVSGDYRFVYKNGDTESTAASASMAATGSANGQVCWKGAFLAKDETCSLTLRFVPQGVKGTKTGAISLPYQFSNKAIPISGVALSGELYISSSTIQFPNSNVDTPRTQQITIGNGGTGYLKLGNLRRAAGTTPGAPAFPTIFTMEHNCPTQLEPGEECTIAVTFAPEYNYNYSTINPLETIWIRHESNGTTSDSWITLKGISTGSTLTASLTSWALGDYHLNKPVEQTDRKVITYQNTGTASVTVLTVPSVRVFDLQPETSTCVAGLKLLPGEKCVLDLKINEQVNTADLASHVVMTINGDHVDSNGVLIANGHRAVRLSLIANSRPHVSVSTQSPVTLSALKSTELALMGAGLDADTVGHIGETALPTTWNSAAGILTVTMPAQPQGVSSVILELRSKRKYGYAPLKLTVTYERESVRLFDSGLDTYTLEEDIPVGVKNAAAVRNVSPTEFVRGVGGTFAYQSGSQLTLMDSKGSVTRVLSAGDLFTENTYFYGHTLSISGNKVYAAAMMRVNSNSNTPIWSDDYAVLDKTYPMTYYPYYLKRATVYLTTLTVKEYELVGNNLVLQGSRNEKAFPVPVWSASTNLNEKLYAEFYYDGKGGASTSIILLSGGNAITDGMQDYYSNLPQGSGSSYSVYRKNVYGAPSRLVHYQPIGRPATTLPAGLDAVVAKQGTDNGNSAFFFKVGADIYSLAGNTSAIKRYNYPGLAAASNSLAFMPATQELVVGCRDGISLCVIKTAGGDLGAMTTLEGDVATGYVDGNAGAVRLSASHLLSNYGENSVLLRGSFRGNYMSRVISPGMVTARANFSVTADAVAFGNVVVGAGQPVFSISLANTGERDGYVSAANIVNDSTGRFSIVSNDCVGIVKPGEYCTIVVGAKSTTVGTFGADLIVDTIAQTNRMDFPISMTVVNGQPPAP